MGPSPHNSPAVALTLSGEEGIIASLSMEFEELTGFPGAALIGAPLKRILAPSDALQWPVMIESARTQGVWQGSLFLVGSRGEEVRTKSRLSILACGTASQEEFLLLSVPGGGEPFQSGTGNGMQEIVGQIRRFAHDLNNPLAVMLGFTQLMLLDRDCRGSLRDDAAKVYEELQQAVGVIERLNSYAASLLNRA